MKKILVVGGAGYIGSHMVSLLQEREGYIPVVLDDLSYGHKEMLSDDVDFIEGCAGDGKLLDSIFNNHDISAVMHFASFIQVGESVENPSIYYDNNVAKTISLINSMIRNKVSNFIFSSTAATFGNPEYVPIDEKHPQQPINPYGRSKLMIEQLLADYKNAYKGDDYNFNYGILRYFNACGAHSNGRIGEWHNPETHLIPLVLQAASGRRDNIKIFGTDYNTKDGSCIRDYIHIEDLSDAHLKLFEYMAGDGDINNKETSFNLGTGEGISVIEIIDTAKNVTGRDITSIIEARRAGDPESLIADGKKAMEVLGWKPVKSDIETIIKTAWDWELKLQEMDL